MITSDYRSAWTRYGLRPGCYHAAPNNSRLCQVGESFPRTPKDFGLHAQARVAERNISTLREAWPQARFAER
ncbi:MAG: hypothetical protein WCF58_05350 [Syntrophobacteraceae bacterium]